MLVSIGRKYGNIMSIDLNHLYLVIYILWSLNMKIINLKPQLVEVLRFLTFLCFLWICSAILSAIIPSQISNSNAGWIQLIISLSLTCVFYYIRKAVTVKKSMAIQLN